MDVVEVVEKILEYGEICDHCLGRMAGKRSFGLTNDERGHALRICHALARDEPFRPPLEPCWICQDAFRDVETWAGRIGTAVQGIEFGTFLIGTRVPPLMAESEEMVWSDLSLTSPEPLKSEMNREVGKAFSRISGKEADLANPDIVAILDLTSGDVAIQVNPVFFYGRYRKLERGIPQTHWGCRVCQGAGCDRCNFTGKMYQDSVEELIGRPAIELLSADGAVLHGAGREDIDARMIGTGRPFVMELVGPARRQVDLGLLQETINRSAAGRVEVALERWTHRAEVETIKSDKGYKKYRILVGIEGPFPIDELRSALKALEGVTIHQRTPQRVAHRRADKIRERHATEIAYIGQESDGYVIEVTGEAGLYIKELISGDDGRTRPSLTEILGRPAKVSRLDVVQVESTREE